MFSMLVNMLIMLVTMLVMLVNTPTREHLDGTLQLPLMPPMRAAPCTV